MDYISGGYFIARAIKRPEYLGADLVPEQIITLSRCIGDIFPDDWALSWVSCEVEHRKIKAERFGIPKDEIEVVIDWVTTRFASKEIGYPGCFFLLDTAREFASKFLPRRDDLLLLGIGLSPELVNKFLDQEKPVPGFGNSGEWEAINRKLSMSLGGTVLGFDVLGGDGCIFHSWYCNDLQIDAYREFGARPNTLGLLNSFEQASQTAEYAMRDDVGAEPGLWLPWLIASYTFC